MNGIRVFTGKTRHESGRAATAIDKQEIRGTLWLSETGLDGDEQADPVHHGGPDRALHQYPPVHYANWQRRFPAHAEHFSPAAFGENLSIDGWTEENVHIGDVFSWGEALIQVSQPRSPCYKLNQRFQLPDLALHMQQTALCGWLLRVLHSGQVGPDALFARHQRGSDISVRKAMHIAFGHLADDINYQRLLAVDSLSASWRRTLQRRLDSGEIEAWAGRLYGPAPTSI